MKKKMVVDLINKNIRIYECLQFNCNNSPFTNFYINGISYNALPDISEIDELCKVLYNEMETFYDEKIFLYNELKQYQSVCNHTVKFFYGGPFGKSCKCALCGLSSRNLLYYEENNFLRYSADFILSDDEETFNDELEIYKMLLTKIKEFNDEDEIDFVKVLKDFKYNKMDVNSVRKLKIYNILVLGGTNTIEIDDNTYIKKNNLCNSIEVLNRFLGIPGVYITLLDNYIPSELSKYDLDSYRMFKYNTYEEFKQKLDELKSIKFNVVVDITNLFSYEIVDGKIVTKKENIQLDGLFNNSEIIKLDSMEDIPKIKKLTLR